MLLCYEAITLKHSLLLLWRKQVGIGMLLAGLPASQCLGSPPLKYRGNPQAIHHYKHYEGESI